MIKIFKTSLTVQVLTGMALSFLLVILVMARVGNREIMWAMGEQYADAAYNTARTARTYLNPDHIADYVSPAASVRLPPPGRHPCRAAGGRRGDAPASLPGHYNRP